MPSHIHGVLQVKITFWCAMGSDSQSLAISIRRYATVAKRTKSEHYGELQTLYCVKVIALHTLTQPRADQICINQSSIPEREQQVALMGQLYQQARQVLICLSVKLENIQQMADFLNHCHAQMTEGVRKYGSWKEIPMWDAADAAELDDDPRVMTFAAMTDDRYLRRTWTVQEVGLAADPRLQLGPGIDIPWDHFVEISYFLARKVRVSEYCMVPGAVTVAMAGWTDDAKSRKRQITMQNADYGLLHCISVSRGLGVTDRRDRIYGMLGHPLAKADCGSTTIIPVDYTIEKEEVFTRFARAWIETKNDLSILGAAGYVENSGMPSWVPAWETCGYVTDLGFDPEQHANVSRYYDTSCVLCEDLLIVRGAIIDEIGAALPLLEDDNKLAFEKYDDPIIQTWSQLRGQAVCRVIDQTKVQAFSRSLARGGFQETHLRESEEAFSRKLIHLGGSEQASHMEKVLMAHGEDQVWHDESVRYTPEDDERSKGHVRFVEEILTGRVFVHTKKFGVVGVGPQQTLPGDVLVIVFGCNQPLILRRKDEGYVIVGAAYAQAFMTGQEIRTFLNHGIVEEEEFILY